MPKVARRKKKKKILSDEDKAKAELRRKLINLFELSSFQHLSPHDNKFVDFHGRNGDIDTLFLFDNVIVICEETVTKAENLKSHILKTVDVWEVFANASKEDLFNLIKSKYPSFEEKRNPIYDPEHYKFIYLYVSSSTIKDEYKERKPWISYMTYPEIQYFLFTAGIIKKSNRFELFKFLNVEKKELGLPSSGKDNDDEYAGLLLPKTTSGYCQARYILSFLMEPDKLIEQAYVLRKQGWRKSSFAYQRLLSKKKILKLRTFLVKEKRVFVNNIIVTLPSDTRVFNAVTKQEIIAPPPGMEKVSIQLPNGIESIGIIDGQHRIYAYHEADDSADGDISRLRKKQHLLVTGIVFPSDTTDEDRAAFEAKQFYEINNNQTRLSSSLRQDIEALVEPFSRTAISKLIINNLNKLSPFEDLFEENAFHPGKKIPTTSIITNGLNRVVNHKAPDTLFSVWPNDNKARLFQNQDRSLMTQYVDFCSGEIRRIFQAFEKYAPYGYWDITRKKNGILTSTTFIAILLLLLRLIREGKPRTREYYESGFSKLNYPSIFDGDCFAKYSSSNWLSLADDIYVACFADNIIEAPSAAPPPLSSA